MLPQIGDKIARLPARLGRLNPTLSEAHVAAFERAHCIALPEGYRDFLLRVGDGGLGPGGGLADLAEAARRSPTTDLDRPFPFSFRADAEDHARFAADVDAGWGAEAFDRELERHGGVPWRDR